MPSPNDGAFGHAVVSLLREASASGAPVVSLVRSSSALGKRTRDLSDEFILGGIVGAAAVALGGAAWLMSASSKARRTEAPAARRTVSRKDVLEWYALMEIDYSTRAPMAFLAALSERGNRYTLGSAVGTYDVVRQGFRDKAWTRLGIDPFFGEKYRTEALLADATSALQMGSKDADICSPLERAAVRLGALRASCQQYAILGGSVEKYRENKLKSEKLQVEAVAAVRREIAEATSIKSIDALRNQVKSAYRRVRKSKPKTLDETMHGAELVEAQAATLRWLGELPEKQQIAYFRAEAFLKWERNSTVITPKV